MKTKFFKSVFCSGSILALGLLAQPGLLFSSESGNGVLGGYRGSSGELHRNLELAWFAPDVSCVQIQSSL